MKAAFRQSMAWLHTWCGLMLGWVLFFMFLTGTAGYFDTEIDRWMQPERPLAVADATAADVVARALPRLESKSRQAERWFISLPVTRDNLDLRIFWREQPNADGKRGKNGNMTLDAATGEPVIYRDIKGPRGGQGRPNVSQTSPCPMACPTGILNPFVCAPKTTKAPQMQGFRRIAGAGFEPATFGL